MNPWLLYHPVTQAFPTVLVDAARRDPQHATNREVRAYHHAEYVRPVVLLFDGKDAANRFRAHHWERFAHARLVPTNAGGSHRRVHQDNHTDVLEGRAACAPVEMLLLVYPRSPSPRRRSPRPRHPRHLYHDAKDVVVACPLTDMQNDALLRASIVSFLLFFYVDTYTVDRNTLSLQGLLLDPFETSAAADLSSSSTTTATTYRDTVLFEYLRDMTV